MVPESRMQGELTTSFLRFTTSPPLRFLNFFSGVPKRLLVLCNMVVAVVTYNSRFGFFMNWTGNQKGEGFEFHLLAIAILLGVMLRGAGPASIDRAIRRGGA